MRIYKLLKVADGLIGLVNTDRVDLPVIAAGDVEILVTGYGALFKAKNMEIPIPETVLGHLINTGTIIIYCSGDEFYLSEPALALEISREALIEVRGIMNFQKNNIV
ncbi:MAG: hypothetical protein ACE5DO_03385 [Desulfobacterales bacterium]